MSSTDIITISGVAPYPGPVSTTATFIDQNGTTLIFNNFTAPIPTPISDYLAVVGNFSLTFTIPTGQPILDFTIHDTIGFTIHDAFGTAPGVDSGSNGPLSFILKRTIGNGIDTVTVTGSDAYIADPFAPTKNTLLATISYVSSGITFVSDFSPDIINPIGPYTVSLDVPTGAKLVGITVTDSAPDVISVGSDGKIISTGTATYTATGVTGGASGPLTFTETSTAATPLPPVVNNENFSAIYGTPIRLTASQLLGGDTDPQSGTLSVTAVSGSGVVLNNDGSATYTPPTVAVSGNQASFSYTVTDAMGLSSVANATVNLSAPPPITISAKELQTIGADLITFYHDANAHRSTAADATKLAGDLSGLNFTAASQLGSLITKALAPLGTTASTTLGTDIANQFFPKLGADIANNGLGLTTDLTSMVKTVVGTSVDYLFRVNHGSSPGVALAATLTDYKLSQ